MVIINSNITKPKCWLGSWSNCQLPGHFNWAVWDLQSSNQSFEYCSDHQLIALHSLPNSPPDHDNISFFYTHGTTVFLSKGNLFMFIPTIIVETSPSLEHFFHSPTLKCLKILTLGCCQTSRKKKKSCMLKCCISKFNNTVTICHKRSISPWVQL